MSDEQAPQGAATPEVQTLDNVFYGRSSYVGRPESAPLKSNDGGGDAPAAETRPPAEGGNEAPAPAEAAPEAGGQSAEQEAAPEGEKSTEQSAQGEESPSAEQSASPSGDAPAEEEKSEEVKVLEEKTRRLEENFQRLSTASSEIRKREQALKDREKTVKGYETQLEKLQQNPQQFILEHLGEDGFKRLSESYLQGKSAPSQDPAVKALVDEVKSLREQVAQKDQATAQAGTEQEYRAISQTYFTQVGEEIHKDGNKGLLDFYSESEVRKKVADVAFSELNKQEDLLGRVLTPQEVRELLGSMDLTPARLVGSIRSDLQRRLGKTVSKPAGQTPTNPPGSEANQRGPTAVTSDLAKDPSHMGPTEFDLLPPRERMRIIAQRHSGG